jgi:diacylglycerol kinase (ATP)
MEHLEGAMQRLIKAFRNSARAFGWLARSETAFQQEVVLLLLSLPVGWFLADTWRGYALLVGSLVVLMIVEVLNTAVEAACDALSREFNADIQLAKDCGSLAVLLAVVLVAGVWILAIAERVGGFPL